MSDQGQASGKNNQVEAVGAAESADADESSSRKYDSSYQVPDRPSQAEGDRETVERDIDARKAKGDL